MDWTKLDNPVRDLDLLKDARSVLEDAHGDGVFDVDISAAIDSLKRFIRRNRLKGKTNSAKLLTVIAAGEVLSEIVNEAIETHIYEREPKRCPERRAIVAFDQAVKEAKN